MNKEGFRCTDATNQARPGLMAPGFFNFHQLIQQFARFLQGIA
jgi:hypothetical protein